MHEISILHGPRITLRPVRPEDVAARLRYGRDPEFHRMCGGDPDDCKPLTEEDVQRWFEHFSQEPFGWTIEYEGRLIGTARLHSHNCRIDAPGTPSASTIRRSGAGTGHRDDTAGAGLCL